MTKSVVLVSACLVGLRCRYDGKVIVDSRIQDALAEHTWLAVCPEQLGGLSTPRPPSQISGGDGFDVLSGKAGVISEDGTDVTDLFIRGGKEALKLAQYGEVVKVIFQDKSPSCGVRRIYHGEKVVQGCGVTTALLIDEGFVVISIEELLQGE
jgi:uncharacterized protein YbbK (DUF523 family)